MSAPVNPRLAALLLGGQLILTALAAGYVRSQVQRRLRALDDQERTHAAALNLLADTLPYLRTGLNRESAERTVELLLARLEVQAAAVVDTHQVLAYAGVGADHHRPGAPVRTQLTRQALESGETLVALRRAEVGCERQDCPLSAAIVAPLKVRGRTVGALKLYRAFGAGLGTTEREVVKLLAKLFSAQLELSELEAQAARVAEAELAALRAQISPHFLFNTLTTIASFIRTKPELAHDLVIDFAEFFRQSLKKRRESCSLAEELDYVEKYLGFERARLGDRLHVDYAISPDCLQTMVPVLTIQPLVENAIHHGLQPKRGAGKVRIVAQRRNGECEVVVEDDGVGIPPEKLAHVLEPGYGTGLGVGLSNVDQRLRSMYGPSSGLQITSEPERGTRVIVRVPATAAPEHKPQRARAHR